MTPLSYDMTLERLYNLQGLRWKGYNSSRTGKVAFLTDFLVKKRNKGHSGTQIMQISCNIILCRLDNLLGIRWKRTSGSGTGEIAFLTDFMVRKVE